MKKGAGRGYLVYELRSQHGAVEWIRRMVGGRRMKFNTNVNLALGEAGD